MASSRRPEAISTYVAQLPGSTAADRQSWIQQRMEQRSDWAYKELVALLKNIRSSGEDALTMPGSIYGAIGLCQFMPTNISHYGADGNGDGVVNLFTVPDAWRASPTTSRSTAGTRPRPAPRSRRSSRPITV